MTQLCEEECRKFSVALNARMTHKIEKCSCTVSQCQRHVIDMAEWIHREAFRHKRLIAVRTCSCFFAGLPAILSQGPQWQKICAQKCA